MNMLSINRLLIRHILAIKHPPNNNSLFSVHHLLQLLLRTLLNKTIT